MADPNHIRQIYERYPDLVSKGDVDGILALYAEDNQPLRVIAEGLTTEETLPGYWMGRITTDDEELRATVHHGERDFEWTLRLD